MIELHPASPLVLVASAVMVSPALWDALVVGSLPLDIALTRFLLTVIASWTAFSLAAWLLPTKASAKTHQDTGGTSR